MCYNASEKAAYPLLYHYWALPAIAGVLVALALTEFWWLRLREDDIPAESYIGESYTGQVALPEIPDWLQRDTETPEAAEKHLRYIRNLNLRLQGKS